MCIRDRAYNVWLVVVSLLTEKPTPHYPRRYPCPRDSCLVSVMSVKSPRPSRVNTVPVCLSVGLMPVTCQFLLGLRKAIATKTVPEVRYFLAPYREVSGATIPQHFPHVRVRTYILRSTRYDLVSHRSVRWATQTRLLSCV